MHNKSIFTFFLTRMFELIGFLSRYGSENCCQAGEKPYNSKNEIQISFYQIWRENSLWTFQPCMFIWSVWKFTFVGFIYRSRTCPTALLFNLEKTLNLSRRLKSYLSYKVVQELFCASESLPLKIFHRFSEIETMETIMESKLFLTRYTYRRNAC